MQPPLIKIKFSPIIRQVQKDNIKCCLEIVPDVSCIQNLDAIEWNDENKLVEYRVPVTYKIILKRDTEKDLVLEQEKIYYSCIDLRLLRLTSSTNSTLGCGDIPRVISDNFILNKVTADFKSSNIISEGSIKPDDVNKYICLEEQDTVDVTEESNKECLDPLAIKEGNKNEIARNKLDILPTPQSVRVTDDQRPARQIYAECTVSKETTTDISDIGSSKEKKRKLTITSVCTLNTIDDPAGSIAYDEANNKSNISIKYKTKTDFKICKVTESFAVHQFYSEDNRLHKKNVPRERVLPELRVAHFMKNVENEILPLKVLLSEIYRKCVTLGLLWNSNVMPQTAPVFYHKHTNNIKVLNNDEQKPKCNRVVYSIVFEE